MSARSAKGRADLVEVKERNAELESQVAELKGILALKESGLERSEADLALARLDADSRGAENERLKSKIASLKGDRRMKPRGRSRSGGSSGEEGDGRYLLASFEEVPVDVEQVEAEIGQEEVVTANKLESEFGPLADEAAKLDAGTSGQFVPSEY
ncbi:unnamed protein product [Microthlaspi erraticum]|uniref:Uncharacterized protein n=1 Tax=Microthlaspi erraticum TaxID=1685480 RepID=A0A6D2HIQ1_9BRAS|nr:unnamed protein product [Microthlaspi erraticum]